MLFSNQGKPSGAMEILSTAGTIGLQLVTATFVGLAMGYFLDEWLGTSPWLLIVFLLLGIVAGFRDVFLEARRIQRRSEGDHGAESGPRGSDPK
ncbi:MAG: AtpZ/AtpI family protein [Humidesulfovibrio sp.]|uniref:AtpZ/AtpI family protein n=1 Tax=Humidesulfovibrio sp. TaxID=2910988 RepID=UPI002737667A|nr:AtpZ/AtpI family protein [Humidesulfovibrio sp.]MDP2846860.1 AtpZ/AtpI family protein [Humidesulfovibrio sp.]